MTPKKKLQVFVSSTYSDLRDERQAAVEAILTAGHIPAGMELFAAGDQSQMEVIKRWIDESDLFLLILGGRYGSIDPSSNKSYIQLEYEYALEKEKPFFAVVIDENYLKERVKVRGIDLYEITYQQQLKDFRKTVLTKLVRFWCDRKDIELAVLRTLSDFARRDDLVGWVPGNEAVNIGALAEEIARLAKENASLREQISKLGVASPFFSGLSFDEMFQLLLSNRIDPTQVSAEMLGILKNVAMAFRHSEPTLLHFFWLCRNALGKERERGRKKSPESHDYLNDLQMFNLVKEYGEDIGSYVYTEYSLTETGKSFLLRLMRYPGSQEATEYHFPKDMDSERDRRASLLKQRATNDENSDGRRDAVQELARNWKDYADTVQILKQRAASDENPEVRQVAVQELALGWKDDPDTLQILTQHAASDENPEVRRAAVHELVRGWKEEPDTLQILTQHASSDENPEVRRAAVHELVRGWKEDPDTLQILKRRAASDENPEVRRAAVQELARGWKEDPDTLQILKRRAASDENPEVRQVAVQELALGWKEDPDTLQILKQRAASDENPDVRQVAVQELACGWKKDPDTLQILKQHAASDENPEVRQVAVQELALSWKEDPDTLQILKQRAASDENPEVRRVAVRELARGWKEDPDTLQILKQHAASDENPEVRRVAVEELGWGWNEDPDTLQILTQRAASDENQQVREMAVRQLKVHYHRDV